MSRQNIKIPTRVDNDDDYFPAWVSDSSSKSLPSTKKNQSNLFKLEQKTIEVNAHISSSCPEFKIPGVVIAVYEGPNLIYSSNQILHYDLEFNRTLHDVTIVINNGVDYNISYNTTHLTIHDMACTTYERNAITTFIFATIHIGFKILFYMKCDAESSQLLNVRFFSHSDIVSYKSNKPKTYDIKLNVIPTIVCKCKPKLIEFK